MPTHPLIQNIESIIVGKTTVVERVVAALMAGGHVLLEDVPGTGKTSLARALARSLDAQFRRVQFTPDLLPTDLTGVSIYNQKTGDFEFRPGPLFTHVLLADELNRATPRTQSALLEAMEERTVSVDGTTHPLPAPFFVIATQNPVEQHGVYQLPEAQLDRFLVRIRLGYASVNEERRIIEAQRDHHPIEDVAPVLDLETLLDGMRRLRNVTVEPNIADYIVRLVAATREHRDVALGASLRGSLALYRICQASAWLDGVSYVAPERVKAFAVSALAHRLVLRPTARLAGNTAEQIIEEILGRVEVPTERLKEVIV